MIRINSKVVIIILSFILVGFVTGCDQNSLYGYTSVGESNTSLNLISFADMNGQVVELGSKAYVHHIRAGPGLLETASRAINTPLSTSSETMLREPVIGDKVIYDKSVPDSAFSIFYSPGLLILGAIGILLILLLLIVYSRVLRSRSKDT